MAAAFAMAVHLLRCYCSCPGGLTGEAGASRCVPADAVAVAAGPQQGRTGCLLGSISSLRMELSRRDSWRPITDFTMPSICRAGQAGWVGGCVGWGALRAAPGRHAGGRAVRRQQ